MKRSTALLAPLFALLTSACATGSWFDTINTAPPDTGPGCYDHRGRLERSIPTPFECASLGWNWRT